ncbi:MAG: tripartite tricarboxylate transporter substrate binding protein [Burkholderiales bacterium]|nr:tripartite tricarboxylate transporter substrate binding protein [Burkholderiales bacterium]
MKALAGLLVAAALSAAAFPAAAQTPIRIVVPTTAGGPLDIVARILAGVLARNMKETVIVDNRPGAGAMIGSDIVAKAPPDGRTLLLASGFVVTNAVLMKQAPDPVRDFKPVIELTRSGQVMAVRKGLPIRTPADIARVAAQQPGGLNCAAGPGEAGLACDQLRHALGGHIVSVPYPGVAPAMNALVAGQVDIMIAPFDAVLAQQDRVVPIATTAASPHMAPFDKLPLLKDTFPGIVVAGFLGVMAPPGTPDETIRMLNREMNAALRDAQMNEFMLARGSNMAYDSPPERLAQHLAERLEYYRKVVEALGLKPQ